MAQILLKRTVRRRPGSGDTYSVTSYYHNTDTYADEVEITEEAELPSVYSAPPTELLGSYCRYTTRYDVYHSPAQDGTSTLTPTPNSPLCPLPDPEDDEPGDIATGLDNDPTAPPGAVLLYRQCRPRTGDTFSYEDRYYDPATRTIVRIASAVGVYAPTCTTYRRPTTEIFDRWCLEKGVAPFTERQVSWNGVSLLVFTDVDNVATCQLPACTLTLSATVTPAGEDGLGSVTLLPAAAVGAVVFTRVGSPDPAQSSADFTDLPTGRYTFEARETRAGGCTARVRVRVVAVYGPRYRLPYRDHNGQCCELLLHKRGYQGPTEKLLGKPDAVIVDWPGGALDHLYTQRLRGSECALTLLLTYREQMLDTFSGDERLFRVEKHIAGSLFWRGYLLPEQYSVAHLPGLRELSLQATDGLAALDNIPFAGPLGEALRGDWTALEIVQYCLSRLDIELPLHVRVLLFPRGASVQQCSLEQARFDVAQYQDDKGQPWSCGKVLNAWLDVLQARLLQQDGAFWLERLADLDTEELSYHAYAPDGSALPAVTRTLLRTITRPDEAADPLYYEDAIQTQGLRGAVKRVQVTAAPGELANLLREEVFIDVEAVDSAGRPVGWVGGAPVTVLPAAKRGESGVLRLPGAPAGTLAPVAAFVQTPASAPVPAYTVNGLPLQLTLTVIVRSAQDMPADENDRPKLYVGLRHGERWLQAGDISGEGDQRLVGLRLTALDTELKLTSGGYGRVLDNTRGEIAVRVLQVVAPSGHAAYDVEIKAIELNWYAQGFPDTYADITLQEGRLLVTRVDEEQELFHVDTPEVRYEGSLLTAAGLPTATWFEPANPAGLYPIHSFLVNDRFLWQRFPAQTLSGKLRGQLRPGDLLTNPFERRPAVYVLTSARYHGVQATWELNGVQNLRLAAPLLTLPQGAIYFENEAAWLSEAGELLLYENA